MRLEQRMMADKGPTHVRTALHAIENGIREGVAPEVADDVLGAGRLHDGRKDAFDLVPSLLDGVDVALGRTAFEARTCCGCGTH